MNHTCGECFHLAGKPRSGKIRPCLSWPLPLRCRDDDPACHRFMPIEVGKKIFSPPKNGTVTNSRANNWIFEGNDE
mgnify:CR=1 FL=1